ncbi:MAG: hypothetical protein ACKOXB_10445 [Flavobacteriales bacterium]
MKFTILFPAILLILISSTLKAQTNNRELGLRFTSLNNYGFVYKKGLTENKYRRYTLGTFNFITASAESGTTIVNNASFSFGNEHRKAMSDNLKFIHGFEPTFALGYTYNNDGILMASAGLGYVLGFQYDFSPKFYLNIEAVPSFSLTYLGGMIISNAGFSTSGLAISMVHKFHKEVK